MHIETAQMLCTELRRRGHDVPYKSTHRGHPVTMWLRHDGALLWMLRYFEALDEEYVYRRGKRHASFTKTYAAVKRGVTKEVSRRARRPPFANSARNKSWGLDFTSETSVTQAYKKYLNARWPGDNNPRWTRRRPPSWCEWEVEVVKGRYVLCRSER